MELALFAHSSCHPAGIFHRPNEFATKGKSIGLKVLLKKVPMVFTKVPLTKAGLSCYLRFLKEANKFSTKGESILTVIAGCRRFFQ